MREILKKGIYTGTKKWTNGRTQHVQSVPMFNDFGEFIGYCYIYHRK